MRTRSRGGWKGQRFLSCEAWILQKHVQSVCFRGRRLCGFHLIAMLSPGSLHSGFPELNTPLFLFPLSHWFIAFLQETVKL